METQLGETMMGVMMMKGRRNVRDKRLRPEKVVGRQTVTRPHGETHESKR